jgi:hypothetical protein
MADARGEYWYFEPGVDSTKITVPELRSILLKHGVGYPSSAKKPQLVALFNESVAPQAAQVQRTQARTKRTTRGIIDVPSSSSSSSNTNTNSAAGNGHGHGDNDTDAHTLLAPAAATRRTARRTPRAAAEDAEDAARAPARAVPAKHSRALEPDVDERPAARRTRKSIAPAHKEPTPDPEAWHRPGPESPFTQENPFQSGSSPAGPEHKNRRRTLGSPPAHRRAQRRAVRPVHRRAVAQDVRHGRRTRPRARARQH